MKVLNTLYEKLIIFFHTIFYWRSWSTNVKSKIKKIYISVMMRATFCSSLGLHNMYVYVYILEQNIYLGTSVVRNFFKTVSFKKKTCFLMTFRFIIDWLFQTLPNQSIIKNSLFLEKCSNIEELKFIIGNCDTCCVLCPNYTIIVRYDLMSCELQYYVMYSDKNWNFAVSA